jgi:hypothetical protein
MSLYGSGRRLRPAMPPELRWVLARVILIQELRPRTVRGRCSSHRLLAVLLPFAYAHVPSALGPFGSPRCHIAQKELRDQSRGTTLAHFRGVIAALGPVLACFAPLGTRLVAIARHFIFRFQL